ncbi:unnamed protein product [Leptidea sinapis]|uniref:Insulin-like domain-containing protein n=1 Tax=Leptidea sinapis TaxID=189913 RepID=A0A5E4PY92_9NEOP|nr:unnamed protein product [Leptidea sinapis]
MNLLTCAIFLIVTIVSVTHSQKVNVYCGRRLAQTLALVCDNQPSYKRSESSNSFDYDWPSNRKGITMTDIREDLDIGDFFMPSNKAHALMRGKRQIVQECCEKPCSIEELITYC